jgi:hypothetical protein
MSNQISFLANVNYLLRQKEEPDSSDFNLPRIVEVKSHKEPLDKTVHPKMIRASGVREIVTDKLENITLEPNFFPAKVKRIVPAGTFL